MNEDEKGVVHVNLISQAEMKAHVKEMRSEIDRKFVKALMVWGFSKRAANETVGEWNAQLGIR